MFNDQYHPKVKKDLKQIDKSLLPEIKNVHIQNILNDPLKGDSLSGIFTGIYSYHFKKNKVEYRICYLINSEKKIVYILMIGKRENFYKLLKRRL